MSCRRGCGIAINTDYLTLAVARRFPQFPGVECDLEYTLTRFSTDAVDLHEMCCFINKLYRSLVLFGLSESFNLVDIAMLFVNIQFLHWTGLISLVWMRSMTDSNHAMNREIWRSHLILTLGDLDLDTLPQWVISCLKCCGSKLGAINPIAVFLNQWPMRGNETLTTDYPDNS